MNTIATFRKCTLSNDELLKKVDQMTDGLFDLKHKSERDRLLTRHIPAQPDNDYDLLVGELLIRFQLLTDACREVVKGYEGDGFEQMRTRDVVFYESCKLALSPQKCGGSCGSNYCEEHGCIDRKPTVDESNVVSSSV